MPIKIIIADDHAMIREGLKQLLELDGDIIVAGEANDGQECIDMVKKLKPDVLLLDINMPGLDGLQTLSIIKKQKTNTKVIMLTIHRGMEYLVKALDMGCDGYVLKDSSISILKSAVLSVYNGESFIEPELAPLINSHLAERDVMADKVRELTKRELEVLKLIANGLFNKEIAAELDISERTVKNHISNIFHKIGVSDRTQAAVFAIKNDIVSVK